jgi:hypothetical protein
MDLVVDRFLVRVALQRSGVGVNAEANLPGRLWSGVVFCGRLGMLCGLGGFGGFGGSRESCWAAD